MASLDFDTEKNVFREYYSSNYQLLEDAEKSFCALINALVTHSGNIAISKIEGRVKDKEECIRKFNRKYRAELEAREQCYSIQDHLSDVIGIRVVCLYEDDIEKISDLLKEHFEVIEITNKIELIEKTEDSFGYKGLHLDLKLGSSRNSLPEYAAYKNLNFEIQIRTIIQDSWSVLDHKIKYKKSIPNRLKRRINTLAALFELADREFKEIRDSTEYEIRKASEDDNTQDVVGPQTAQEQANLSKLLNAFGFLKIANHFFKGYEFEPKKVDGFTEEIVSAEPSITRSKFNAYMRENYSLVKDYQAYLLKEKNEQLNPYTVIRHCLYLGDKEVHKLALTNVAKDSLEEWLTTRS